MTVTQFPGSRARKEKIGFRLIGFWRAVSETGGSLSAGEERQIPAQVVWMIAWEDLDERARKWAELGADEKWRSVIDPRYYVSTSNKIIEPTGYSPLQ